LSDRFIAVPLGGPLGPLNFDIRGSGMAVLVHSEAGLPRHHRFGR